MEPLQRSFYTRPPDIVAKELLGKTLLRTIDKTTLSGMIVETEAYFGKIDPASRAYKGKKKYNAVMFETPGRLFIYMVHGWWLLNVVAHILGESGAVLIRSLEPLEGLYLMYRNRPVQNKIQLTNGPGKLAKALDITKKLNGVDITSSGEITIINSCINDIVIDTTHRIGVTQDLPKQLRYYIRGNRFISS